MSFGVDTSKAPYTTTLQTRGPNKGQPAMELSSWENVASSASGEKIGNGRGSPAGRTAAVSVLFEEMSCGTEEERKKDIADEDAKKTDNNGQPSRKMQDCEETRDANKHFFDAILKKDYELVGDEDPNCLFVKNEDGDYIPGTCTPKVLDMGKLFTGHELCVARKGDGDEVNARTVG